MRTWSICSAWSCWSAESGSSTCVSPACSAAFPAAPLSSALTPVAITGLILMIPSGVTMFASDAASLVHSTTFRWKLLLILIALANAIAFRILWHQKIERWDTEPPPWGRLMAIVSVLLWLSVATLGRMIAYS